MRYIIGVLISIGLIILLIVLLTHHDNNGKVPLTKTPLISYANTDTVVRETIDDTINAPQDHRITKITVGRNNTTFELIQGYGNNSLKTQLYPMTETAYAVFLRALQHAGFTLGNDSSSLRDERGYCPLGRRYIFEVQQSGSDIERYWTTSCGNNVVSTFKGNVSTVLALFQNQVPNYDQLTNQSDNFLGL